jgi:hypothetical protein
MLNKHYYTGSLLTIQGCLITLRALLPVLLTLFTSLLEKLEKQVYFNVAVSHQSLDRPTRWALEKARSN